MTPFQQCFIDLKNDVFEKICHAQEHYYSSLEDQTFNKPLVFVDEPPLPMTHRHGLINELIKVGDTINELVLDDLNTDKRLLDFKVFEEEVQKFTKTVASFYPKKQINLSSWSYIGVSLGLYLNNFAQFILEVKHLISADIQNNTRWHSNLFSKKVFETACQALNCHNKIELFHLLKRQYLELCQQVNEIELSIAYPKLTLLRYKMCVAQASFAHIPHSPDVFNDKDWTKIFMLGGLPYADEFKDDYQWKGLNEYDLEHYSQPDIVPDDLPIAKEAMVYKRGTIPWGAYIQIDCFPFVGLRLFEMPSGVVHAFWFTQGGKFFTVSNEIYLGGDEEAFFSTIRQAYNEHYDTSDPQFVRFNQTPAHICALGQLLCFLTTCVVRDFWVIEERDTVLGAPKLVRLKGKMNSFGTIVVYLPRIKYHPSQAKEQMSEFDYKNRIAHMVSGFFRRLPDGHKPSLEQLEYAHANHLFVPPQHTYVRPHERGEVSAERLRIYRSKSALTAYSELQLEQWGMPLMSLSPTQFERLCGRYVEACGYTVTRYAVSNTKDRGIDIHAYKEVDGQAYRLIAQCKRYAKNVGSPELREFLGSHVIHELMETEVHEKWLFSSFGFTNECIEQAELAKIRLISGFDLK